MSIESLSISKPFFELKFIQNENSYIIKSPSILINLSNVKISIKDQLLSKYHSLIVKNIKVTNIKKAVLVVLNNNEDDKKIMSQMRKKWPSAYEVRKEERLKGVHHYMSPKKWIGQYGFTVYHSSSVPLNVGMHKDHPFCPLPGFKEIHTQIIGFGKMQQFKAKNLKDLYIEEIMAPGVTHQPMFDKKGNYPWHQFETITPSVFLAIEMLPRGARPPSLGK